MIFDTGKRIPCFDRCQLTITLSNIKYVCCKPISWNMAAMFRVVVVVGCTRPRSTLLAMLTMKKELNSFLFIYVHVVVFL